jgi:hypothetical protein
MNWTISYFTSIMMIINLICFLVLKILSISIDNFRFVKIFILNCYPLYINNIYNQGRYIIECLIVIKHCFFLGTFYLNAYGYLDLLIGTWIYTKKFIMKRIVWLFIDKNSFISSNRFLKLKIWIIHLTTPSQNGIIYIDSHSKFVIRTQYMM